MNHTLESMILNGRYGFKVSSENEVAREIDVFVGNNAFRTVTLFKDADFFAVNNGKSMTASLLKALCEAFVDASDRSYFWNNSYRTLRCSYSNAWANPFEA